MALVSLAEIKAVMFDADHQSPDSETAELTRLHAAGIKAVQAELGGPIEAVTVTDDRAVAAGDSLWLSLTTATAVTSVSPQGGTAEDSATYALAGAGRVRRAYGYSWSGEQVVTYTAGWADEDVPDEVNQAVIRYVQWSWSRAHGGSDSYQAPGVDSVIGLGIDGIRKEIRFVLGDLAAGPVVA